MFPTASGITFRNPYVSENGISIQIEQDLSASSIITVRFRYNAINFLQNYHKRHIMASTLGDMRCRLQMQIAIHILAQELQRCMVML